jgi:multicomponent Na+:H+ antiporter subunit B
MSSRVVLLEVAARLLYTPILLISLWILLRGHDEPGGGFIGGLLAVVASVFYAVAFGTESACRRIPGTHPLALGAFGALLTVFAGLPALVFSQPFLTHYWATIPLGFMNYKVSTVMVFDIGVYLCVWGALAGYSLSLMDASAIEDRS